MNKPRVALLHYAAPPVIGGVETTLAAQARLFADHGYRVQVIAGRGAAFDARIPVSILPDADTRAPRVLEVNRQLARGTVSPEFHALARDLETALVSALGDCDVLIAHNALSLHKNLALTTALRSIANTPRVKIIAWCHDLAWHDPVYADQLHAGLPWDLLRQVWDGVRYVVVSTARQKELARLLHLEEKDVAVVPPGIDALEFLGIGETAARWARAFRWLDAAPLLLLPARVTRRKNIELAIEITAALRELGRAPQLVVMGPLGPHNPANAAYLQELRGLQRARHAEDAVLFLQEHGTVDDATRRDLYWLADALLFPSAREGFGIPILEAGLARLPIFCSDTPSAPFRESAGANAHYFSLDESPALIARRMAQFLDQDACYQLKQRVLREYAWDRIFAQRIQPLVEGG